MAHVLQPTNTMHNALRLTDEEEATRRALPRRFNFTVDTLNRLTVPAGKDRIWVFDTKTPKLAYLLTKTGARSFYIYTKVKDRTSPIRFLLGPGDLPLDNVRKRCAAEMVRVHAGIDIQAERRTKRETIAASINVGELWQKYHDDWLKVQARSSTITSDVSLYKTTLKKWSSRRADTLTEAQCRSRHAEIGRDIGHRTANKAMELLRRMLNWARLPNPITRGAINWFAEAERERYLAADELKRFFAAIDQEPSQTLADYLKMAVLTGGRKGNLQRMRWSHIDLEAGVWNIPATESKNRKPLRVVLSQAAVVLLKTRRSAIDRAKPGHDIYVFPSHRRAGSHLTEPRGAMERALERAKLEDVRLHDLRRTFGSWQAASGASELIIGKSLGHASREATHVYSRIDMTPVRASVEAATAAMLAAIRPTPAKGAKAKKK
jgi:integrase